MWWDFFFLYSSLFRILIPDVKRAFNQRPNPPFLFFLPSVPFFEYYHPKNVTRSTSTNTSQSSRRLMQVFFVLKTIRICNKWFFFVLSRFIINIPAEQREDLVRVLFAVELAHWFFIDFYCEDYNDLHVCSIKEFAQQSKHKKQVHFFANIFLN
jgi:hypothetical protein